MTTPTTTPSGAMTPAADSVRGRILWHDLMTPDVAASHRFYSAVLGWGAEEWKEAPTPYTMWTVDGTPSGGYAEFTPEMKQQGIPPHWITYFGVQDVDAAADAAVARGAQKQLMEDIPTVGRIAVMQDPQGAWFTFFAPIDPPSDFAGKPPIGNASWHELWTTDAAAGYEFYVELLGWESAGEFEDPQIGKYRMFGRNGTALGGVTTITKEMANVPPNWLPYFRVADLEAAVARVREHGGQILVEPMQVPGGDRIAQCMDALGGAFALHQVE